MKETEAIRRVRRRDWSGLEALIERYQLRAVRAACLVIGDKQEAEDIVIEAFYRAWDRFDQFDDARPFAPWFFTLVMNSARRSANRSVRLVDLPEGDPPNPEAFAQIDPDPEEVLIQAQSQEEVRQVLAWLPLEQRIAIVQKYFLEWTVEQMANQAGRPQGTIKWRLSEARKRLRDWLNRFQENRMNSKLDSERSQDVSQ